MIYLKSHAHHHMGSDPADMHAMQGGQPAAGSLSATSFAGLRELAGVAPGPSPALNHSTDPAGMHAVQGGQPAAGSLGATSFGGLREQVGAAPGPSPAPNPNPSTSRARGGPSLLSMLGNARARPHGKGPAAGGGGGKPADLAGLAALVGAVRGPAGKAQRR